MAYCDMPRQMFQVFLLERLTYQTHRGVYPYALAVGGGDARAFLASMLKRVQSEKGYSRYVLSARVNTDYTTRLVQVVVCGICRFCFRALCFVVQTGDLHTLV